MISFPSLENLASDFFLSQFAFCLGVNGVIVLLTHSLPCMIHINPPKVLSVKHQLHLFIWMRGNKQQTALLLFCPSELHFKSVYFHL